VVKKLQNRKKAWIGLSEDLVVVAKRMKKINHWVSELPMERKSLAYINNMLILQHQASFLTLLNGVENQMQFNLSKSDDEYFSKLQILRETIVRCNQAQICLLRSNGNFISQTSIAPCDIEFTKGYYEEFDDFAQQQQTVIDESAMIPKEVRVLRKIYGYSSQFNNRDTTAGYQCLLRSAFYNMDDKQRSQLASTFEQYDEVIHDYLKFKDLAPVVVPKG